MKRKIQAGTTSLSLPVIVYDNTSTTGAGLSGLTHTTSGLVLEYRRQGQSSWTQLGVGTGLVSKTLGTYVSGGIVASGSRAGRYEIDIPNDAIAAGARIVEICLRGAANMHPVDIEIELDAVNYQDATRFGLTAIPNVAQGSSGALATGDASGQVTVATLTSSAIQSIWDALTSGLLTAGSIGKWIIDNLNTTVSSRASQASVDGKPTLVQIEASTVLAKEQSVSSVLDRLGSFTGSGANTVLGFFRALMRKDASAPTPSDVGGTFTNTTDSLEAIRDRGDAAWTTGAGGGGGGGDPWATDLPAGNYTANQAGGILQTVLSKTNTIQSGKVAYAGPVTAKGTVDQIIIGDDYLTAHGTAFVWTIPAIPGMSAPDVTVHFGGRNGANTFGVTGTATDIGSGKWSLTAQMPKATSGQLVAGEYRYSVAVHNPAGVELTRIYYDDPLVAVEKFTP